MVGGVERLAVRLCRLVCLLRGQDPGCELPLSAPVLWGGRLQRPDSPAPWASPSWGWGPQGAGQAVLTRYGTHGGTLTSEAPPLHVAVADTTGVASLAGCAAHGLAQPCAQRSDLNGPLAAPTHDSQSHGFALSLTQPRFWELGGLSGFLGLMKR